jgi:hypothetical protein
MDNFFIIEDYCREKDYKVNENEEDFFIVEKPNIIYLGNLTCVKKNPKRDSWYNYLYPQKEIKKIHKSPKTLISISQL